MEIDRDKISEAYLGAIRASEIAESKVNESDSTDLFGTHARELASKVEGIKIGLGFAVTGKGEDVESLLELGPKEYIRKITEEGRNHRARFLEFLEEHERLNLSEIVG